MMDLYVWGPKDHGDDIYYLMTQQGEVLGSHLSSDAGFAVGDLAGHIKRDEALHQYLQAPMYWPQDEPGPLLPCGSLTKQQLREAHNFYEEAESAASSD